jgi:hypothetical protein
MDKTSTNQSEPDTRSAIWVFWTLVLGVIAACAIFSIVKW